MLQVHAWTPMDDGLHHVPGAGAGTWYYYYLSPRWEGAQRLALRAHTLIFLCLEEAEHKGPMGQAAGLGTPQCPRPPSHEGFGC